MPSCLSTHVHANTNTSQERDSRTLAHTCSHMYIHTYMHTYIPTYIHSYRHSSIYPSIHPSIHPSSHPAIQPSSHPAIQPSSHPAIQPSSQPASQPSSHPSMQACRHASMHHLAPMQPCMSMYAFRRAGMQTFMRAYECLCAHMECECVTPKRTESHSGTVIQSRQHQLLDNLGL